MNLEALRQASQLAEIIWPYAWPIAVAALSSGWLSPIYSEKQKINVVEPYRKLTGYINKDKFSKRKPKSWDIFRRNVLMITRGAKIHSDRLGNR